MLAFLVCGLFWCLGYMFSFNSSNYQSDSPFECGFVPQMGSHPPFSIRFFMMTVVFLVFDIEIILLIPLMMVPYSLMLGASIYVIGGILLLGLFYEWMIGSLDWFM